MAFVCKNKLFWAKVGLDEGLELFTVLFVLLQRGACDLQSSVMSTEKVKKKGGNALFSWYIPHVGGSAQLSATIPQHYTLHGAQFEVQQGPCRAGVQRSHKETRGT
jgi:hypothetical protein